MLAAIFDVDGVLIASPHERAWQEVLQELMVNEWADVLQTSSYSPDRFTSLVYQQIVAGKPRLMGALSALEYFGVRDAARRSEVYAARKQARLEQLIREGRVPPFEDAIRFALALKALGARLALASASANADAMLRTIDIRPYLGADAVAGQTPGTTLLDLFDADVSGRGLPHGKPLPDIFLVAASELKVDPEACIVVEDAPAGVIAAKAAGMAAIGVSRANDEQLLRTAGADLVVSSLDDVDLDALSAHQLRPRDGTTQPDLD